QVADADDRHRPLAVDAQLAAQGCDDFLRGVADAGVAEVAEVGEVLADLGVGDAEGLAELAAGDGPHPRAVEPFEGPQVKAQARDRGRGEARRAAVDAPGFGGGIRFAHAPLANLRSWGSRAGPLTALPALPTLAVPRRAVKLLRPARGRPPGGE